MGSVTPSLKALVGGGTGSIDIFFINNGTTTIEKFDMAVDNIRIVK
jgi:hypothetical protein